LFYNKNNNTRGGDYDNLAHNTKAANMNKSFDNNNFFGNTGRARSYSDYSNFVLNQMTQFKTCPGFMNLSYSNLSTHENQSIKKYIKKFKNFSTKFNQDTPFANNKANFQPKTDGKND
jgi:hypothetical protein